LEEDFHHLVVQHRFLRGSLENQYALSSNSKLALQPASMNPD
jgi:hypothetical protein